MMVAVAVVAVVASLQSWTSADSLCPGLSLANPKRDYEAPSKKHLADSSSSSRQRSLHFTLVPSEHTGKFISILCLIAL